MALVALKSDKRRQSSSNFSWGFLKVNSPGYRIAGIFRGWKLLRIAGSRIFAMKTFTNCGKRHWHAHWWWHRGTQWKFPQLKLSWIVAKPQNLLKFSPAKDSRHTVLKACPHCTLNVHRLQPHCKKEKNKRDWMCVEPIHFGGGLKVDWNGTLALALLPACNSALPQATTKMLTEDMISFVSCDKMIADMI